VTITLDRTLLFDFINIAKGVYSPLQGVMSRNDFLKLINDMTLESGVPWPLPVILDVDAELSEDISPSQRIGIRSPDGTPVGVLDVDSVYKYDDTKVCKQLFRTTNDDHPGVRALTSKGPFLIGGSIKAFADAIHRNGEQDLSPKKTRVL
jgi:sulfate adenylyltransferase